MLTRIDLSTCIRRMQGVLAGFKSHLQLGGQEALLSELDDDFVISSDPEPLTYPDAVFD